MSRGVTRNQAIVLGHLIRIAKLYECFLMHTCERHAEICMIFFRLIFETAVRLEYLTGAKRQSFSQFVQTSYRPEKEQLKDLKSKARHRGLIPIEKRMLRSITAHLRSDGIPQKELLSRRSWDLDGKSFRSLLNDVTQEDWGYPYAFGNGSHFVHGDWFDMKLFHVSRDGRWYHPKAHFTTSDPRVTCATTTVCLRALAIYLRWRRVDPDRVVRSLVVELAEINEAFDIAYERHIQTAN